MKPFYSILFCNLHASINERVAVGLFMSTPQKLYYQFSQEKLQLCRKLLPNDSFKLARDVMNDIHSVLEKREAAKSKSLFSADVRIVNHDFGTNVFGYLANYANNALSYSDPIQISVEANAETFEKLYRHYIGFQDKIPITDKKRDHKKKVISLLKPKIELNLNWNVNLKDQLPHCYTSTIIDFIGENGRPVVGEGIDFNAQPKSIEGRISAIYNAIATLQLNRKFDGKYFFIGDEPDKKESQDQHRIWHQLQQEDYFDFVPTDEISRITEYVQKNGVRPMFSDL